MITRVQNDDVTITIGEHNGQTIVQISNRNFDSGSAIVVDEGGFEHRFYVRIYGDDKYSPVADDDPIEDQHIALPELRI